MVTLHDRMFIAQSTLEAWIDAGHAEVHDEILVLERLNRAYHLEPAARFLSKVSGGGSHGIVGRVLSQREIGALGGEMLGESVLMGETAYQVRSGFIASLRPLEKRARQTTR